MKLGGGLGLLTLAICHQSRKTKDPKIKNNWSKMLRQQNKQETVILVYFDPLKLPLTTILGGVCSYIFSLREMYIRGGGGHLENREKCMPWIPQEWKWTLGEMYLTLGGEALVYTLVRGWGLQDITIVVEYLSLRFISCTALLAL